MQQLKSECNRVNSEGPVMRGEARILPCRRVAEASMKRHSGVAGVQRCKTNPISPGACCAKQSQFAGDRQREGVSYTADYAKQSQWTLPRALVVCPQGHQEKKRLAASLRTGLLRETKPICRTAGSGAEHPLCETKPMEGGESACSVPARASEETPCGVTTSGEAGVSCETKPICRWPN